jgi:hypothetical protein
MFPSSEDKKELLNSNPLSIGIRTSKDIFPSYKKAVNGKNKISLLVEVGDFYNEK